MLMQSYIHLIDEDLMLLLQKGDNQAFEHLVDRYKGKIYNYLYRVIGNYEDADEKTWEVFYKIDDNKNDFTDPKPNSFAKWIFTIARNTRIDFIRKTKSDIGYDKLPIPEEPQTPEDVIINKEKESNEQKHLEYLLGELEEILILRVKEGKKRKNGDLQFEAYRLYYIEGYSMEQVLDSIIPMAEEYGIKVDCEKFKKLVNNWLSGNRILKKLCSHLINEHKDIFEPQYLADVIRDTTLSCEEHRLIENYWFRGNSLEIIACEESIPIEDVGRILRNIINKIIGKITTNVSDEVSRRPRIMKEET